MQSNKGLYAMGNGMCSLTALAFFSLCIASKKSLFALFLTFRSKFFEFMNTDRPNSSHKIRYKGLS